VSIPEGLERLRHTISGIGPMAVGFSAGVDSTLLLWAAHDVLGERAVGVTTVSASLPLLEKQAAARIAREIGARHQFVESGEMEDPRFLENGNRRCYFCKAELFRILRREAGRLGLGAVAYGAQKDDLGEFRPGMEAAREHGARAPLLEAGLGKSGIREISRYLGLSTWNKPAMACLSSRIPHGTPITRKVLGRVERAEATVRAEGFRLFRVRAKGDAARLELARDEMGRLDEKGRRERLVQLLLKAGYASVFIDPLGYRPGGGATFGNEAESGLESPG
jgi:pyridinium-3,5-biscarboxylic acid mononucleotide sulfurtransferase